MIQMSFNIRVRGELKLNKNTRSNKEGSKEAVCSCITIFQDQQRYKHSSVCAIQNTDEYEHQRKIYQQIQMSFNTQV